MIKPTLKVPRNKKEFAQTMVEFALVFPIVLLVIYGIIEFGRMVFIYAAVTGAAREGARYGAAAGDFNDQFYMDCTGILGAVQRGAILIPINDVSIWYDRGPGGSIVSTSCPPVDIYGIDKIKRGDRIVVHVVAHYAPIITFLRLEGFDIVSENARTILFNVEVDGASLPSKNIDFTSVITRLGDSASTFYQSLIQRNPGAHPRDFLIYNN